jgi:chemotaxis protein CheC
MLSVASGDRAAIPNYAEEDVDHLLPSEKTEKNPTVLLAPARFNIEELQVQGEIILFFDVGSFELLLEAIAAVA